MSTEERIMALERGLVATQNDFLVHLAEFNLNMGRLNKVIAAQELHGREIDHNLTMLLGIASGQEGAIKVMRGDLDIVKGDLDIVKGDLDIVRGDLDIVKGDLDIIKERVEDINQQVTEVKQDINGLHAKFDQQGKLLLQILDRLPSP